MPCIAGKKAQWFNHFLNPLTVSYEYNIHFLYDLKIVFLYIYSREIENTHPLRLACVHIAAALIIAKY